MNIENALKLFHDLTNIFISSPFGYRNAVYDNNGKLIASAGFHDGGDYASNGKSVPVYAIEDGKVLAEGKDSTGGIFCYIYYPRIGYVGLYYHLTCTYISKGDSVNKNTKLGMTGMTGLANGIHLHFGWFKYSEYSKALRSRNYEDYNTYKFPEYAVGTPVARNENVDQIEVIVDQLNARKTPNGERIAYINKGIYNVISTQAAGDFTWYQVENNVWIACNKDWNIVYPRKETELEKAKRELDQLKIQSSEKDKQILELQNQLNSFKKIEAYIKE
jgi:hypothetical protein